MVASVKMQAEMQTPSAKVPLKLNSDDHGKEPNIETSQTIQGIVHFDLREEGNHVLAVTLSYNENTISKDRSASSGRVRSFRKLYQFAAQPCLGVRTKISPLVDSSGEQTQQLSYSLEAQLENLADAAVTLEKISFTPRTESALQVQSMNWDDITNDKEDGEIEQSPCLSPRDVWQVAFLVKAMDDPLPENMITKDGRVILGQLVIQWRTAMGNKGYLSTGWLLARET